MDDATFQRVCGLATALRQSAHLLLDHHHKLSLDTWTLREIQEAFSLILEIEQHTNFHVLPPNHRQHPAIPQLQFIYDLLQKVSGLRLWAKQGQSLPESETTSLRCFRSLQTLELHHVPVTSLKALQTLRPTLKSIISVKGLNKLSDLFIRCGADKAGEFVWDQLQEAVLAHNSLYVLDHSLSLLPKLRILDLSHCELEDASALEYLLSVAVLNISHNKLRLIPRVSPSATYSITTLLANNNLFSHIEGLQEMSNIEELDLRENILTLHDVLCPIGALPHIRVLNLEGNPLTSNQNHRILVIKQLNRATANHQVTVDGLPLSTQEQSLVGISSSAESSYSQELLSSLSLLSNFCSPINFLTSPAPEVSSPLFPSDCKEEPEQDNSIPSQPQSLSQEISSSLQSTGNDHQRRKLRKTRTRQIAIAEPDNNEQSAITSDGVEMPPRSLLDGLPDDVTPTSGNGPLSLQISAHTEAPAVSSIMCQEEMSIAIPEQSDKLLEKILKETPESPKGQVAILVTASTSDKNKGSRPSSLSLDIEEQQDIPDNYLSLDDGDGNYGGDSSRDLSTESSICQDNSKFSDFSADVTPPQSEDEDEDAHRFLARRETTRIVKITAAPEDEAQSIEEKVIQDVIIAITPMFFKEKNGVTARTIYRWDLCSLESMEVLGVTPHKVLITFNTLKNEYKKRTYILDFCDYQQFCAVVSPILERNTLEEVLTSAMTCLKCSTQFSRDLAKQSDGSGVLKCPNCGGGVVVRVDKVDHPAVSEAIFDAKDPCTSTPVSHAFTQASCLPSADLPPCQGESSESVSVCSEGSSYVRRESDVEVISNPSISSIEILNDQQIIHDVILEEGDEQKLPLPADVNSDARTPANSPSTLHKPDSSTGMQESSSSGSMSGSVCTTYEKSGSLPTSPIKNSSHHHSQTDLMDSKNVTLDSHNATTASLYKTAESSLLSTTLYGTPPHSAGSSPHLFSSSSTSIDTIKIDNMIPSLHHKAVMTSVMDDKADEKVSLRSLTSWVQSLLHTLTGYGWLWWEEVDDVEGIHRIANPIRYSYEDFTDIDHRLKLYCEVLLFHEPEELLLGLVKAVILIKGGLREFQGLLVLSSKKIYVLEIVGLEDDSPQSWLELRLSHKLTEISIIHSLYQRQGLGLTLADDLLLLSLADSHRANCFFNFFLEAVEEYGVSPSIQECSPAQEESLTSIVNECLPSSVEETSLPMFAIVSLLLGGGCSESQFLTLTNTDLLLFHANLEWYMPSVPDSKLKLNVTQKIANITAIEVHSDCHLGLQFLDEVTGVESSWELHVTTPVAACHIIQAIRTPWMHLFSVDLEDFIGVYQTKEGDLLSMTHMAVDGNSTDEKKGCQSWCQVSTVRRKLKYDPKYPILGYDNDRESTIFKEDLQEVPNMDVQFNQRLSPILECKVSSDLVGDNDKAGDGMASIVTTENLKCDVLHTRMSHHPPVFKQKDGNPSVSFD